MKKALLCIAVGLLGVGAAYGQDSTKRVLAEELLDVMLVQEGIEKSYAMVKEMMPAQMEQMRLATGQTDVPAMDSGRVEKMMEMVGQELSWENLKDEYITLYAEVFSEEEMEGLIAFYKSPVGRAFAKKQPDLMRRTMELSQSRMVHLMPRIQALMAEPTGTAPSSVAQDNKNE